VSFLQSLRTHILFFICFYSIYSWTSKTFHSSKIDFLQPVSFCNATVLILLAVLEVCKVTDCECSSSKLSPINAGTVSGVDAESTELNWSSQSVDSASQLGWLQCQKEFSSLIRESLSGEFHWSSTKSAASYERTAEIKTISEQPHFYLQIPQKMTASRGSSSVPQPLEGCFRSATCHWKSLGSSCPQWHRPSVMPENSTSGLHLCSFGTVQMHADTATG